MPNQERSIVASVDIAAPEDRVWEIASDTHRYAEWVESTLEVLHSDGPASPGSTYDELTRVGGPWKTATHWRVTEFDAPTRQVHAGKGLITARGMGLVMETAPAGGSTRFTMTLRYTPRFGRLGAALDRLVAGSVTRAQQRSAQTFAEIVEHEQAARPADVHAHAS
jgi:uncharacterized protein YndB with AHSA1/START domain